LSTLLFTLIAASPIVAIAAVYALFDRKPRNGPKQSRGTEPSQGDSLVEGGSGAAAGSSGGGYNTITRVPRDPQKYAKAFVPSKARSSK